MSHGGQSGPESAESSHNAMRGPSQPDYASTLETAQSSRIHSAMQGGDEQSQSESQQADPSSEDGRIRILRELEGTVESFRGRKVSKTGAISSILRILGENADVSITQSQKDATFDSYLTELLSIQASHDESANSGESGAQPDSCPPPK
jgi:hypothetical protein